MNKFTIDLGKIASVTAAWVLLPWQFALVYTLHICTCTITFKKKP